MNLPVQPELVIQIIALLVGIATAAISMYIYNRNSRLRHSEWLYQLYEKFFFLETYSEMRRMIDYGHRHPEEIEQLRKAITTGTDDALEEKLVNFLNFFQFIASLWKLKQLSLSEIEFMFKYYLHRLGDYPFLLKYMKDVGFGHLLSLVTVVRRKGGSRRG